MFIKIQGEGHPYHEPYAVPFIKSLTDPLVNKTI